MEGLALHMYPGGAKASRLRKEHAMGLDAKRRIGRLSAEVLPRYEQELAAIVGASVGLIVDWTYFLEQAGALDGLEQWGLATVTQALRQLGADEVGRTALAGAVSVVRLSQWPAPWPAGTIADGNLDLAWDWGAERFSAEQLAAHLARQL